MLPCAVTRFRLSAASSRSTGPVDGETAQQMAEIFFEVVIAPGFADETIETLGKRKALRLLRMPEAPGVGCGAARNWDVRPIAGGLLVQTADCARPMTGDLAGGHQRGARQPGDGRSELRLAGRAARQIERHRPGAGPRA